MQARRRSHADSPCLPSCSVVYTACREADFFQLPELAERARAALADAEAAAAAAVAATAAAALPAACPGEDTPSDVPATFALEGSAHGGQLAASRLGGGASRQASGAPAGPATLDALFLETGFQPAAGLAEAQASVLQRLNATVSGALDGGGRRRSASGGGSPDN